MEVQSYEVAGWIVVGERCDRRLRIALPIENSSWAFLRHVLPPYRKHARVAIGKLGSGFAVSWGHMNRLHRWLCRSDRWRNTVAQRLPWAIADIDLGPNVLEIGPGLTTNLLRTSVHRLTTLEIDPKLAGSLSSRLKGSNVRVIEGDATQMPLGRPSFWGAVSFSMLHQVPSPELQNKVLTEVLRGLQPGGFFVGRDGVQNWFMRIIHIGDTLVPVNPDAFGARLESTGFEVLATQRNSPSFPIPRSSTPCIAGQNTNRVN